MLHLLPDCREGECVGIVEMILKCQSFIISLLTEYYRYEMGVSFFMHVLHENTVVKGRFVRNKKDCLLGLGSSYV